MHGTSSVWISVWKYVFSVTSRQGFEQGHIGAAFSIRFDALRAVMTLHSGAKVAGNWHEQTVSKSKIR